MVLDSPLDAYTRPPEELRALFKKWQKASLQDIDNSPEILNLGNALDVDHAGIKGSKLDRAGSLANAFSIFADSEGSYLESINVDYYQFDVEVLPGLFVYPSLLPESTQICLLDKLFHRDLSNPQHQTNLHLHYEMDEAIYGDPSDHIYNPNLISSFFALHEDKTLKPKDPSIHKAITVKQMMERKLRWITLGGQYDWTSKVYPPTEPPPFPSDIRALLSSIFPDVEAQAAIVNLYTPGDTLSVHRDVSEACDRGLISISIGCDGLFIIGDGKGAKPVTLRLRSGDVVLMSDEARFAWHAVPKILTGTCPRALRDWPASFDGESYQQWKGWLSNKRINLNVRQMQAEPSS